MEFEFDAPKSMSNLAKHGISFNEAKKLWTDPKRMIISAREMTEPRWVAIARIGRRHWSAVFTCRGERIRIISVRRSRKREIALYEG